MKVRDGFVSNSSSSSFIIKNKENIARVTEYMNNSPYGRDYYVLDDVLYTSIIGDCSEDYSDISEFADDEISCGHGMPYDEDSFVEVEGDRGVCSVWIPKDTMETSKRVKLYKELLALDNEDVNAIIKKYQGVWENEMQKWLCI